MDARDRETARLSDVAEVPASVRGGKPLLRGVSHQVAVIVSLLASVMLVVRTRPGLASVCAAVFGVCLTALFAISALYHRIQWSELARQRMRRLDHSAIFILIAGGYTPLFALVRVHPGINVALLGVWLGAAIGVMKSMAWPGAPKWITATLCVGLGWACLGPVIERGAMMGATVMTPLVASGIVYSLGALVYAAKKPDPVPHVFGYHEVFHALVIIASVLLFAHVALVIAHT